MNTPKTFKTGSDPRGLPDYAALRDELAKLSHPARPDVDWERVEQLSLSLFHSNGLELQTLCWYTLARTRLAGMAGLNEGLAPLEMLITQQWGTLWPRPAHARIEILAGLSQRLQAVLRTLTLDYAQLPLIYQAETYLNTVRDLLQRLELKNISQIGELSLFMHNAATRLENQYASQRDPSASVIPAEDRGAQMAAEPATVTVNSDETLPASVGDANGVAKRAPRITAARSQPATSRSGAAEPVVKPGSTPPNTHQVPVNKEISPISPPRQAWQPFVAGMLTMLVVGAIGLWSRQKIDPEPVSPVPVIADAHALTTLAQLSPLWRQEYGFVLAASAEPDEADALKRQWQHYITGNALPTESLAGWHQGMEGLQALTHRLNKLDERKGSYLTGSELKSMVFTITQNFSRSVPLEEQLYLLGQSENAASGRAAQLAQIDMQFSQLLNRYALIKSQAE
ncbi:VasL domain-containing protein [Pantoea sp. GD03673]|uniref:VasL domain-containing protein n=1 Tax=Pantoea sp. GD03673 TaxID=2975364 RepID=UPI00244D1935|nr:VasL domain-containing protein [Pantoea sp. GD03673]MDH2066791.1 type VI secretion system ImpA family N-terminal domain-containing protein [Pantoea sp. GD03673]